MKNMSQNTVEEDIKKLVELQAIYARYFELVKAKENLPLNDSKTKEEMTQSGDSLAKLSKKLSELKDEQKSNNIEIDTLKDDILKIREKQKVVQSPKEFAYLDMQEQNIKSEIDDYTKENAVLIKKIAGLEKDVEKKNKDFEERKDEINKVLLNAKEELVYIDEEINKINKDIEEISAEISPLMLNEFTRIANGKNGVGISPIEETFCTGCHISLPPRIVTKVRRMQEFVHCQSCGRILYWPEY
jgi:predicted  nucleic acid-binding Zn-ribbon protein